MTNQQGAPEALRCAEWLEHIAAGRDVVDIAHLAATSAAELRRLAALVEAQQPAPSATAGEVVAWRINAPSALGHGEVKGQWIDGKPTVAQIEDFSKNAPSCTLQYAYASPTPQADSQPAPVREGERADTLKHALWLASSFAINRYLMSNAEGRWSGAEKATCHDEMCRLYVAVFRGVEVDQVRGNLEDDWTAVHDATQALTDNMDEVIGFPLKGVPDYDALAPKFFDHFHRLATAALNAYRAARAPADSVTAPAGGEINRLRAQVESLTRDCGRQASKIAELGSDLKFQEEKHREDRARLQALYEHQRGECWYWQGDGQDHLESLCNTLPVVIRADQLRALVSTPPAQTADSVLEDAAFEAVRKNLCALQRYSFCLDDDGVVRRVQDRTGNWIEFDDAHKLFDPVAVDAARKQGGA